MVKYERGTSTRALPSPLYFVKCDDVLGLELASIEGTYTSLYTCKLEPKNVVTFNERLLHSPPASPRKSAPPDHLSSEAELKESISVSEKGSRKVSFTSVLCFF